MAGVERTPAVIPALEVDVQVVPDHDHLLRLAVVMCHLFHEGDDVIRGASGTEAMENLTVLHVEGRDERRGAVTFVLELVATRPAGLGRLAPVGTLQGLDAGLLVRAQHHRVAWGLEVQADDVVHLLLEERILAVQPHLRLVRPQLDLGKGALDAGPAHGRAFDTRLGGLGQTIQGPRSALGVAIVDGVVAGDGEHLAALADGELAGRTTTGAVVETLDALREVSPLPFDHGLHAQLERLGHVDGRLPVHEEPPDDCGTHIKPVFHTPTAQP